MSQPIRYEGTPDIPAIPEKRRPQKAPPKHVTTHDRMGSLQGTSATPASDNDFLTDPLAQITLKSEQALGKSAPGMLFPDTSFAATVLNVVLTVIKSNANTLKAWSEVQQSTYTSLSKAWDKFAETDMQAIKQQATQSIIAGAGSVLTVAASAYSLYKAGSSWKQTSEGLTKSQEQIRLAKANLGDTGAIVKTGGPSANLSPTTTAASSATTTSSTSTSTAPAAPRPQGTYAERRKALHDKLQQSYELNTPKHEKALEKLNKQHSIAERKAYALDTYGHDRAQLNAELAAIKKDAAPIKTKLSEAEAEVKKIYAKEKKESTAAAGIGQAGAGIGQLVGSGGAGVYGVTTAEVHREKDLAQKATQLDHMLTNLAAEGVKKAVDLTEGVISEINRMLQTFYSTQRA